MTSQPRLIKEEQPDYSVDDAQKAEYRERLRQYLQDPGFRQIKGFPLGNDEDILSVSNPPHHTACPNPFLIFNNEEGGVDNSYPREVLPYTGDFKVANRHEVYSFHPYHIGYKLRV
jgi:hypothetical protein